MRVIIKKDKKIRQDEYDELLSRYSKFIEENTTIVPVFFTEDYDFTDYPTNVDVDGDDVPRPTMLQEIADDVTKRYGKWGADHIVTLIHEDNWKSGATSRRKGISGTNYSYVYNNYHLQYVRWWKRKGLSKERELNNSFGTLNHEQDHSYDALIKQEIGIDVNPILGVKNYDRNTTHGQPEAYHGYIKFKENADKLKVLAPYLIASYKARLDKHEEVVKGMQMKAVSLLKDLVYLLRKKVNIKNGVSNS